jgi:hypothetical protein
LYNIIVKMNTQDKRAIIITKNSGETELFDVYKLKASLNKAGADEETINEIAVNIENWVYDGVTTGEIYSRAYMIFRDLLGEKATRYKLKKALFDMGPTGYPFEHFIGELFKKQGYEVEVGIVVEGVAITHEMDVIATKDGVQHLMECKYVHDDGNRLSVQVPLYVHSRVNDIVEKRQQQDQYKDLSFYPWVVTNARFSSDSMEYSKCKGIQLLGWDYPRDNALKDLIEREKIYPITVLGHLNKNEQQRLMEDGIVTCTQLSEQPERLNNMGLSKEIQRAIMSELEEIIGK